MEKKRPSIIKFIWLLIKLTAIGFGRNVLRIGGHGGDHRMREGAVVSRFARSDSYRRRYLGRHQRNIWEPMWT